MKILWKQETEEKQKEERRRIRNVQRKFKKGKVSESETSVLCGRVEKDEY